MNKYMQDYLKETADYLPDSKEDENKIWREFACAALTGSLASDAEDYERTIEKHIDFSIKCADTMLEEAKKRERV